MQPPQELQDEGSPGTPDPSLRREGSPDPWKTAQTLEALVHSFPLAIMALSADGCVRLWNPAAERLFGWSQEDVLGRPMPHIPPDRRREHETLFRVALAGKELRGLELVRQRRDGSLLEVSVTTAPLLSIEGDRIGVMAIYEDMTQRRQAEAQLRGRYRQLSALYDASQAFLHPTDPVRILEIACRLTTERFGQGAAWVSVSSAADSQLLPVAAHGVDLEHMAPSHPLQAPEGEELADTAVRTRHAAAHDVTSGRWRAAAAVPIASGDRVLGLLNTLSEESGHYTEERLQVLESFANLTAVALEAARLREQAIRHAAALEERVRERTADLERFVVAATGRELRIAELEETVRFLTEQIQALDGRTDAEVTAANAPVTEP